MQLNSGSLRPHRDSNDRLVPAVLAMAAHTQLLLDATSMKTGQVNTVGIANFEVMHTKSTIAALVGIEGSQDNAASCCSHCIRPVGLDDMTERL